MKRVIMAAAAVLTLTAGAAFAQSFTHNAPPANQHQTTNGR